MGVGRNLAWCGVAMIGMGLAGCGQPTKYESASFSDSAAVAKQAGGYWGKQGWWGLKNGDRKVVITEFSVEYVTGNASSTGASPLSVLGAAEMVGMGKKKKEFTPALMENLPTRLYAGYVQALEAEGFTVVPMEKVTTNSAFKDLSGADAGDGHWEAGRTGLGGINNNQKRELTVYPVKGLPVVDDSWLRGIGNSQAELRIIGETGANVGMRVRMRVALDDDGHVVLDKGSTVRVKYDMGSGDKLGGGKNYWATGSGVMQSKGAMRDDVPVYTGKEFKAFQGDVYTIDSEKFEQSLMKMYPTYARMAAVTVKG